MTDFRIGTPVVHHDMANDRAGYVVEVKAADGSTSVLGASGFQRVRQELKIVFEGSELTEVPDTIAERWKEEAERRQIAPIGEAKAAKLLAVALQARADARERQRLASEEAARQRALFVADAEQRIPAGAKAVIIAEMISDRSDYMSDYHGGTTVRTIILGFSSHERDLFSEMRKAALNHPETAHLATEPETAEHREKYSMGGGYYLKAGYRYDDGWKISKQRISGPQGIPTGEWATMAPASPETVPAAAGTGATGGRIVEQKHSKRGFTMFIVTLAERVERERFEHLRDAAKDAGGWYSRAFGKSPAGFAFKQREAAEAFQREHCGGDAQPSPATAPSPQVKPAPAAKGAAIADKLRTMADALQASIDDKFRDRRNNTPKQQREAQSARLDGYRLERTQKAMRRLADLHEAGTVPPTLAGIVTKAAIFDLVRGEIERSGGYYDAGHETGRPALQTPAALALWDIVNESGAERRKADELRQKIDALRFAKIPGYFPTPAPIVARMIEAADIPDGPCSVLEPEAGTGAILDALRDAAPHATLFAFERQCSLREILAAKGYQLTGADFMESDPALRVDRVLMNPPFEHLQDAAHIMRAFHHLKPGGRLVSIMSPSAFFRADKAARFFRDWFEDLGGERQDLPPGSFKESGTGTGTVLIILDAPAAVESTGFAWQRHANALQPSLFEREA
jgi:hypothetical protein